MSYFKDIDDWLNKLLVALPNDQIETTKAEIKAKLLESYRNGQAAQNPANGTSPRSERVNNSETQFEIV